MLKINEAIIVEGRYDKQKLSSIVDAIIIETRGFRIFNDKSKRDYIKKIAKERGIIILTDSDSAGFLIRNSLKSFIPEKHIKQAYITPIKGKEKRKTEESKEGLLGVEGVKNEDIINALKQVSSFKDETTIIYTVADLFELGLTGSNDSKEKREAVLNKLGLPKYLSVKDFLKYINSNSNAAKIVFENNK